MAILFNEKSYLNKIGLKSISKKSMITQTVPKSQQKGPEVLLPTWHQASPEQPSC